MSTWTIDAMKVGEADLPIEELAFRDRSGRELTIPLIMYVLRSGDETIVVDTGGPIDEEHISRHHPYPYRCPPSMHPAAVLAELGVDPASVDLVVNTHLHWDHCGNNHLFENARLVIHRAEIAYATDPLPYHRTAFELHDDVTPSWVGALDRLLLVDCETELRPGVRVVPLPGHTPGSQGVVVDTVDGPYVIAGDCLDLFENWDNGGAAHPRPSGSFTDLVAFHQSLVRMRAEGWEPLPSHDEQAVLTRRFG